MTEPRKIVAKGIRHPIVCVNLAGGGAFVPNDVAVGGDEPPFMLLTGPNMGGKSTLIRQVCLAVVSAQVLIFTILLFATIVLDSFLFVAFGSKVNSAAVNSCNWLD